MHGEPSMQSSCMQGPSSQTEPLPLGIEAKAKAQFTTQILARFSQIDTWYPLLARGLPCFSLYGSAREEIERLAHFSPPTSFVQLHRLGLQTIFLNVKAGTEWAFMTQDLRSLRTGKTIRMTSATNLDFPWESKGWKGRKNSQWGLSPTVGAVWSVGAE